MQLRPYQTRTIADARQFIADGAKSVCIVAPTGAGKTVMGATIGLSAANRNRRVLWLAHRAELLQQAHDALARIGVESGIIAPWAAPTSHPVQVASVQTLLARGSLPRADVVIPDECHHHVSPQWVQLIRQYQSAGATIVGLTATPERSDGVGLCEIYQRIVVSAQVSELIALGHLVPCRAYGPSSRTKSLAEHPLVAYRRYADGRPAVAFCASVHAARDLAAEFRGAGIRAAYVDGDLDWPTREQHVADFRAGKLDILTNMHVLTEGFDAPRVSCIILARGFSSPGAYIQATGRGMRPCESKRDLVIVDLLGCAREHGLPSEDRQYSLEGAGIRSAENPETISQCLACGMWFRSPEFQDSTCPSCGAKRKGKQDPAVRRAIMTAIATAEPDTARTEYLKRQVQLCRVKGWKLGRAMMLYKVRYSHWPSDAMKRAAGF